MPNRIAPCLAFLALLALGAAANAEKTQIGLVIESPRKHWYSDDLDSQAINAASQAFLATRRFQVVERKELKVVFDEKSLKDLIGESDGNSLFDLLGVEMLGFVSYVIDREQHKTSYALNVRLASTATAEVLGTYDSVRPTVVTPWSLALAGDALAANLREAFPPEGVIVQVMNNKQVVINMGTAHGLKAGDSLELILEGEALIDPESGRPLPGTEMRAGKLRVQRANLQTSICKVRSADMPVEVAQRVRYQGQFQGVKRYIPKTGQRLIQRWVKKKTVKKGWN